MKRLSSILMLALSLGVLTLVTGNVSAASNSLGVNPRRDYTLKPGEKVQDTLNVTNLNQTEALAITIKAIDFKAADQTGTPSLLLRQEQPTRWSLKPYLNIASTYTIPAGKSADIPFTVSIPANVGAGSYYSAVQYAVEGATDANGNVNLASSSVSLIFVRVPGEAKSALVLNNFGAFTPNEDMVSGSYKSFYSSAKPKYLSYTLENKGNLAEQPTGSIVLKNIFGKQVKLYENANPNQNLVLIEQTRRIDVCLNEVEVKEKNKVNGQQEEVRKCEDMSLAPGRYTAATSLFYGGNGSASGEIQATTTFWYLPAWFIIAVALILALVAFAVWKLVNKIKNRNKPTYGSRRR